MFLKKLTNTSKYLESGDNLLEFATNSTTAGDYYSSASFCFGASLRYRYAQYVNQDFNASAITAKNELLEAKNAQQNNFKTLHQIQTYAIVEERIQDAEKSYKKAMNNYRDGKVLEAIDSLAYSHERSNTALSWASFYMVEDTSISVSNKELKNACNLALTEAEGRLGYVRLYFDLELEGEKNFRAS